MILENNHDYFPDLAFVLVSAYLWSYHCCCKWKQSLNNWKDMFLPALVAVLRADNVCKCCSH